MRSIIIDDEETGIETLKLLLEKYVDDVKIIAQTTNASEAIEMIENYKPDIIFLDISMPEMDGFELLEKLEWKHFHLVFTTAHQEYGLKALKKSAVDYLLKPIDHRDLKFAVEKIKKTIVDQKENEAQLNITLLNNHTQFKLNKLSVTTKNGIEYIEPNEIIYLESQSNYTLIHLNNSETLLTPKTLKEFEGQLCNT
ncbi:MAG: response regulator transcription factor, partial [Bacteroidia bacterium]